MLARYGMNKKQYEEYRHSAWYDQVQSSTKARAGGFCKKCGSAESLHCHHHRYNCLWMERPSVDTICLCSDCHAEFHGKESPMPTIEQIESKIKPFNPSAAEIESIMQPDNPLWDQKHIYRYYTFLETELAEFLP